MSDALQRRIVALEAENAALRARLFEAAGPTVSCPAHLQPAFDAAERLVADHFARFTAHPSQGQITLGDQRYVLVRAASLSTDFQEAIRALYADRGEEEANRIGQNFLFDVAHVLGKSDAAAFHAATGVTDPISRLSAGPVHFAYTGWAFVDILPESRPTPDDDFHLVYRHPYSFEADAWLRAGRPTRQPVCIMNAGYSAGWCAQSFGLSLTAVEVTCRARGDEACTFIMAPPHRIAAHLGRHPATAAPADPPPAVPSFFERKVAEERLRAAVARSARLLGDLRGTERTLRAVLDSVDDAILRLQTDGTVVEANRRTFELFGRARGTLRGRSFLDDLAPGPGLADAWAEVLGGTPQTRPTTLQRQDGVLFDAEIRLRLVRLEESAYVIAVVRDVSAARAVERLKDEFVSMVSHELRTPVTSVYGALGLVLGAPDGLSPGARGVLEIAHRNVHRLLRILSDILDLERLAAGRLAMTPEVLDLAEVAREAAAANGAYAATFDVQLTTDAPAPVTTRADRYRLLQVLDNLVSNAVKFSPRGAAVALRVTAAGGEACIEVLDRGPGIPVAFQDRVFEPFSQAETAEDRHRYGTGLGLAIARRIVEQLGGRIGFRPREGGGTAFHVQLPAA